MDDFEDPRVRRFRAGTFRQVTKGITAAILRTPVPEIETWRQEAVEKDVDVYQLAAAKVQGIIFEQVTPADRDEAKHALFGFIYGSKQT